MHNDPVQLEFDPAKARANLAKHKVSFAHAEQASRSLCSDNWSCQMRRKSDASSLWGWMRLGESW